MKERPQKIDLQLIRSQLESARGQRYWQSLEEVAETPEFRSMLAREFPPGASEWWDGLSRRSFMKMAAASLALAGITACTKQPTQEILPYVKQPAELVLGQPLFYATALVLNGFAEGVLARNREGHPIKVDGNPEHPVSQGGSHLWMQSSILNLYDPDRSQTVTRLGEVSSWPLFLSDLVSWINDPRFKTGKGWWFLTPTLSSPTLSAQLEELLKRLPQARWCQYDPVSRDNVREGARLAFGEIVEAQYHFDRASVVLSLDSDFLYTHPARLRNTRQFSQSRRYAAAKKDLCRLYVVESTPTVTGSMADHRMPLGSQQIETFIRQLASALGAGPFAGSGMGGSSAAWIPILASELQQNRGKGIIIAGRSQPPFVHLLTHRLNEALGNAGQTIEYTASAEARPLNQFESFQELVRNMEAGRVETLFILGGNPVYTAPVDSNFASLLSRVPRNVHLGAEQDETAICTTWHIPEAHYLEAWGDALAVDGTITLMQPLIAPLYDGKTAYELIGALTQQQPVRSDYEIVRDYWRSRNLWPDFEKGWRQALHDGFLTGSRSPTRQVRLRDNWASAVPGNVPAADELEIQFRPDASVWDGSFANNGWLQECPRPISKLTWDNAALISPLLAQEYGLSTGDVIELTFAGRSLRAPVWILPGQATKTITLPLGYGRTRVGRVGERVGFNAYLLRTAESFWFGRGVRFTKTGERHLLVSTQVHHNLDSPERQVYRVARWSDIQNDPETLRKSLEEPSSEETLYYTDEYRYSGYRWGMSINLSTCIGCNACLVACEVENNIPVVGKEQVNKNREMHWIRVDTYYQGALDNPSFNHMPVPCMQCEHAPCELVCPVEATVHDTEGLNAQVYNRCIGTRFCSNNCPYKVRRFNFLRYTNYDQPSFKPMYNPEVTVRWRGVMEKCTYCVQRIAAARIRSEKEDRKIRDGEVRTACQEACPAEAIVFGDLNTEGSQVAALKSEPLDYSMLGQLNTRPRTTYLAKLQNPNPKLEPTALSGDKAPS